MQAGLRILAASTVRFVDQVVGQCPGLKASRGSIRLRSASSRLGVLVGAKRLVNFGKHVEYEALKVLRVGGIDIHLELNGLIGSWAEGERAEQLGNNLAAFFSSFREAMEEEEEEEQEPGRRGIGIGAEPADPLRSMIQDAILAAQGGAPQLELSPACFPRQLTEVFADEVNSAIDEMLQKRMRTMQQGLKHLADATHKLMASAPVECIWTTGGQVIKTAAKKLKSLTRKTVVDYGAHIKYQAMKSLTVGGVAIHAELNNFLATWKLRSQREAGASFGELMLKLASIPGHDEL